MSKSLYDLSIVIPAFSEEKRIGKTLDELSRYLKKEKLFRSMTVEVLVVSADSPDRTWEIVLAKRKKFAKLTLLKPGPKVGKGRDVQYGMLRAKGSTIMFMDADLATPLRYLPTFYKAIGEKGDIVIGTRNLLKHHPNYIRRLISNGGNILFRIAGGAWIEDSQCGFKMFTKEAAQVCFSKLTILGWGFDMEVIAIAKANRFKIKSYRINDWRSVPEGTFQEGFLENSLRSLHELSRIFIKRMSGFYRTKGN